MNCLSWTQLKSVGHNRGRRVVTGLAILFIFILLAGCGPAQLGQGTGAEPRSETVALPTQGPTRKPTPVNTRVLPLEISTPSPTPSITPIPDEARGLVVKVINGDTLAVVMDGDPGRKAYEVKLIGVEAPPPSDPWGAVAQETGRALAQLKIVELVRDQTDFDAEGYLLRHVYLDNRLLSVMLAEQGLVRAAVESPNTAFEDEILAAEAQAREAQLGIWGSEPPTPTATSGRLSGVETQQEAAETETPAAVTSPATGTPPTTTEPSPTPEATEEPTATGTPTTESSPEPTTEGTPGSE